MNQKLVVYGRLAGMNEYIGACRYNRQAGARLKRENQRIIGACIKEQQLQPMEGKAFFRFVFHEPNMRRDKDNVSSAAIKFVFDELQEQGIIPNDNWHWVDGFSCRFFVDPKFPRIEIEMEEVR